MPLLAVWSGAESLAVGTRVESAGETSPVAWHSAGYGVRSPGQCVCHEAEAATRLLVVTYVGRSPVQVEVCVKGERLRCTLTPDAESPKIGPWECPYHHSRACMEMIDRLASMEEEG